MVCKVHFLTRCACKEVCYLHLSLYSVWKKVLHVDLVFDVGYVSSGSTKICFKEAEDMNIELNKVMYYGAREYSRAVATRSVGTVSTESLFVEIHTHRIPNINYYFVNY